MGVAEQKGLGIRFQAIVPQQMIGGTGVGNAGGSAYTRAKSAMLSSLRSPASCDRSSTATARAWSAR